jgi:hypothetical protein
VQRKTAGAELVEGEVAVSLPRRLIFSVEAAYSSPLAPVSLVNGLKAVQLVVFYWWRDHDDGVSRAGRGGRRDAAAVHCV